MIGNILIFRQTFRKTKSSTTSIIMKWRQFHASLAGKKRIRSTSANGASTTVASYASSRITRWSTRITSLKLSRRWNWNLELRMIIRSRTFISQFTTRRSSDWQRQLIIPKHNLMASRKSFAWASSDSTLDRSIVARIRSSDVEDHRHYASEGRAFGFAQGCRLQLTNRRRQEAHQKCHRHWKCFCFYTVNLHLYKINFSLRHQTALTRNLKKCLKFFLFSRIKRFYFPRFSQNTETMQVILLE